MELEVRVVRGIESCFVSLPLSIIQALASTAGGLLPPVLALELRSPSGACWHVAWSGSASNSSSIEVAQRFADCISLPDRTQVRVKAAGSIPKAEFVTIEPNSEDDWEILELNSELAEEAILKQVCIVNEGMRFPLWLHGHIIVEFLVVSTSPKNLVVQLVPGTEVAVAPKIREKRVESCQDVQRQSLLEEQLKARALLRVQASGREDVHRFKFKDVELGVVLTTVAFIHPGTAKKFSFDNLQLVTLLPRLPPYRKLQNENGINRRRESNIPSMEENNGVSTSGKEMARHTVVRILFSDSVTKGHLMLPQCLRLFLGAVVHSWVYVKKFCNPPKRDVNLMTLSPCHFKLMGKSRGDDTKGMDNLESQSSLKHKNMPSNTDFFPNTKVKDLWQHEEFLSKLSSENFENGGKSGAKYSTAQEKMLLIQSWLIGQLKEIASYTGQTEITSVVLTSATLFHFQVTDHKSGNQRNEPFPCRGALEKGSASREIAVELLYLLTANFDDSSHDALLNSYELVLTSKNKNGNDLHGLELALGNVELGDPVTLESILESSFNKNFNLTLSSLGWMEKATSDVINRLFVLLSPSSGKLLTTFDLPHPGHVLIYGPTGSGKSTMAMAVARYFEEHPEILAHIVFITCSKLSLEKSQTIRQAVTSYLSEALVHAPSIVIFDDLDNIVSVSPESDGPQPPNSVTTVKFFSGILDEYREKCRSYCGYGPIAFIASVQSLGNLPQSLSSSGRFDFHVQLPAPAVSERGAILKHELQKRVLQCSEDILSDIASKCDGYDAYDLCEGGESKEKSLSLHIREDGRVAMWTCFRENCSWRGCIQDGKMLNVGSSQTLKSKKYRALTEADLRLEPLSEETLAYFKKRMISTGTLRRNAIMQRRYKTETVIAFPYRRNGMLVSCKYRGIIDKKFRQESNTERIFYGLDDIRDTSEIIIVEGEMDKLAMEEAGYPNCVSVPDGAPGKVSENLPDEEKDTKFQYLWNCEEYLNQASRIILATDADAPGQALAEELARRLGKERCWRVNWPTESGQVCKDANEVLMYKGLDALREVIENAEFYPIRGLFSSFFPEIDDYYYCRNGYACGVSTGWRALNKLYNVVPGELTVITGVPNSGKSEWIDALLCNINKSEGWTFALCSKKKRVPEHARKLLEKHIGKPFFDARCEDDSLPSVDWVLYLANNAVIRYGVRGLVIVDPYNELDHQCPANQMETEYVSQMLTKIKRFGQHHSCHVLFVAHPRQLQQCGGGPPNLYDISGSAHFINKCDNGIVIHRNREEKSGPLDRVQVCMRNVRNKVIGNIGDAFLSYDRISGQFMDLDGDPQSM